MIARNSLSVFAACSILPVARARAGKLTLADFEGTTISLTNPGTVGTAGSIPRLMAGQDHVGHCLWLRNHDQVRPLDLYYLRARALRHRTDDICAGGLVSHTLSVSG